MPVVNRWREYNEVMGSVTMISPGLFITASHVVEIWLRREHKDLRRLKDGSILSTIEVLQSFKNGGLAVWNIGEVVAVPDSDLAILVATSLTKGGDLVTSLVNSELRINVDLHLPDEKQPVVCFGFPETESSGEFEGVEHTLKPRWVNGPVKGVHKEGGRHVKTATIEIEGSIMSGMSGGAVLNQDNSIIGVNSWGADFDNSSYIAAIRSIFNTPFTVSPNNNKKNTLLEMTEMGIINVIGYEHLELSNGRLYWKTVAPDCSRCSFTRQ